MRPALRSRVSFQRFNLSAPDAQMRDFDLVLFGFDLKWVREFAPLPKITRVPLGPSEVKGLLNLRGEILPLLDVRHALGMKTTGPEKREDENEDATRAHGSRRCRTSKRARSDLGRGNFGCLRRANRSRRPWRTVPIRRIVAGRRALQGANVSRFRFAQTHRRTDESEDLTPRMYIEVTQLHCIRRDTSRVPFGRMSANVTRAVDVMYFFITATGI